jgi:hypothetical protein
MALKAELLDYKAVQLEGVKATWMIPPTDVVDVEGQLFVKLNGRNHGLLQVVITGNSLAPKSLRTLTASTGIKEIVLLRNKAQAAAFEAESNESSCSLFDTTPVKKARVARHDVQAARGAPRTLTVCLPVDGVERDVAVLRPVHPRDTLFVEYELDAITTVLTYIRCSGFDETLQQCRSGLPQGIHRRKDKLYSFAVTYTKPDGTKGQRMCKELADAIAFQADPESADLKPGVALDDDKPDDDDGA